MEKKKFYRLYHFSGEVIQESLSKLTSYLSDTKVSYMDMSITEGNVEWKFDTDEDFFAEYVKPETTAARFVKRFSNAEFKVESTQITISVTIKAQSRDIVEAVFSVFEDNVVAAHQAAKSIIRNSKTDVY